MRRRLVAVAAAVAATAMIVLAPGSRAATPTWENGPTGGDSFNVIRTDPAAGRVTVLRPLSQPPGINCKGGGGYATLRTTLPVTATSDQVTVTYTETATSGYTFLNGSVRTPSGETLGTISQRGPLMNTGTIAIDFEVPLDDKGQPTITSVSLVVGLAVSSACPSVDGGTVRFTDVTIA